MRMIVVMAVSLYTSRIVLEQLGVTDFGIYNAVGGVVLVFQFLNGSMALSSQRFLSFEMGRRDMDRLMRTFKASLTIHLALVLLVFAIAETAGLCLLETRMTIPPDRMAAARWVFQFSILTFSCTIMAVPFNALIISHEDFKVYTYTSLVEAVLKLTIAWLLALNVGDKLVFYAFGLFTVNLGIALFPALYCKFKYSECRFGFCRESELLRKLSSFAGWSLYESLAWVCKIQGVNLVLNILLGPVVNAAYAVSMQVHNALNKVMVSFTSALNPQLVKNYATESYSALTGLIVRGTKFSFLLVIIFTIPLLFSVDQILGIWLKDVPPNAVVFTRLVIINSTLESVCIMMTNSIQATGKIKLLQLLVGTTIFLNLPLSWLFLKLGFNPSCVFVIGIGLTVITIVERIYVMRRTVPQFSVTVFLRDVFLRLAIVVAVMAVVMWLFSLRDWCGFWMVLTVSLLLMAATVLVGFSLGMTRDEQSRIIGFIQSKLLRHT